LVRVSQNVLTCPTTACFNVQRDSDTFFKMGRKVSFFGDGHQFRAKRFGLKGWVIPILSGEFFIEGRVGYREGLMGGNLWFFGSTPEGALEAAERASVAASQIPGVILPFPGGVAASGSKAGSRYSFSIASTYAEFCPTLREKLGEQSKLPAGVVSVQEIIINGKDLNLITEATQAAIRASVETEGLLKISAGNYGGKLGKSFVYLHPRPAGG
jgi:formylmethanofuran--tetrahydromethanopterin N-formyltransferase